MNELMDLYQEVILDHNRRPRNTGAVVDANRRARGDNPLCGDQLSLTLKVSGGRVENIAFEGHGCAISTASASLMTDAVKGKTVAEAEALFRRVHDLLRGTEPPEVPGGAATGDAPDAEPDLGKLQALAGVRDYPMRVKCATLAWHTLHAALEQKDQPVSTET